jgi:hypothetical protein
MAHMLVQQPTHRSSNISIHRSSQKDSTLPMVHSVDERLFLQDSSKLFHFFTRFASEPHMYQYNTQSTNTNGHISKSPVVLPLSPPISDSCVQLNKPENDEIHFDDIFYLNCDKIQPVSTSLIEDVHSYKIDNIKKITTTTDHSSEQVTEINDELNSQQLDDDILLDTSPSINGSDGHGERHFRRRRRRSSLTKTSTLLDETSNSLDKLDINQQQSLEINETLELKPNDDKQDTQVIETKISGNEESNKTMVDDDKLAPLSRYRGRSMC